MSLHGRSLSRLSKRFHVGACMTTLGVWSIHPQILLLTSSSAGSWCVNVVDGAWPSDEDSSKTVVDCFVDSGVRCHPSLRAPSCLTALRV